MTTAGVLSAGLRGLGVCFLVAGCKDLARWAVDALGAHSASTSEGVARYHLDSELMRACSLFVVGMLLLVGARRVASWILAGRDTTLSLGSLRVAALGGVSAGFLLGALGDVLVKGLLSGPPAGSWESGNSHWSASAAAGGLGLVIAWVFARRSPESAAEGSAPPSPRFLVRVSVGGVGLWMAAWGMAFLLWSWVQGWLRPSHWRRSSSQVPQDWVASEWAGFVLGSCAAAYAGWRLRPSQDSATRGDQDAVTQPVLREVVLQVLGWFALLTVMAIAFDRLTESYAVLHSGFELTKDSEVAVRVGLYLLLGFVLLIGVPRLSRSRRELKALAMGMVTMPMSSSAIPRALLAGLCGWLSMGFAPRMLQRGLRGHVGGGSLAEFETLAFIWEGCLLAVSVALFLLLRLVHGRMDRERALAFALSAWAALLLNVELAGGSICAFFDETKVLPPEPAWHHGAVLASVLLPPMAVLFLTRDRPSATTRAAPRAF